MPYFAENKPLVEMLEGAKLLCELQHLSYMRGNKKPNAETPPNLYIVEYLAANSVSMSVPTSVKALSTQDHPETFLFRHLLFDISEQYKTLTLKHKGEIMPIYGCTITHKASGSSLTLISQPERAACETPIAE